MHKNAKIPWAITSLRIAATPFTLWFFGIGNSSLFLSFFFFSLITDLLDGFAARKLDATSRKGGYFDAIADFSLIAGIFFIYVIQGVYPFWILALIMFSFAQFLLTSLTRIQIYDPIGKYFGGLLYLTIIVTSIFQVETLYYLSLHVIAGFFIASLASRIVYLGLLNKQKLTLTLAQIRHKEMKL
ncbi:MAG: CDP-alcohol phosphatidyltransferase family protein [Thermoproteota archaeon]|nr:CDP-alcohol phosphatidyltransferase family protein [Thermoproteota archaeon]